MQTVYIDLYFLINLSMDFLCLYLTAKLLSVRLSLPRALAAAALGGAYACVALLLLPEGAPEIVADIAACAVFCCIAFYRRGEGRRVPMCILVYVAVSATLGGVMTAIFYLFNRTRIFDFIRESDGDGISVWLFAALAALSGAITLLGGRGLVKKTSAREARVRISYGGRSVTLCGIVDSGNLLREPMGGRPCIVVDRKRMKSILPRTVIELSESGGRTGLDRLREEEKKRIVLVPASTAAGGGLLVGIRADGVELEVNGKKRNADALVALSVISEEALVPSCLLI